NHEIVSENLVHATTPGYRRQGVLFEVTGTSVMPSGDGDSAAAPAAVQPTGSYLRLEPGALQQTNNPLDFAVSGNRSFVVEGPKGLWYTRNGSFELGPGGELRTRSGGYRVSGQGGALTIPPTAGDIAVAPDGTVTANGAQIGRLQLASFD